MPFSTGAARAAICIPLEIYCRCMWSLAVLGGWIVAVCCASVSKAATSLACVLRQVLEQALSQERPEALSSVRAKLSAECAAHRATQQSHEQLQQEHAQAAAQLSTTSQSLESLQATHATLTQQHTTQSQNLGQLQADHATLTQEHADQSQALEQLQADHATLTQEHADQSQALGQLQADHATLTQEHADQSQALGQLQADHATLTQEHADQSQALAQLQQDCSIALDQLCLAAQQQLQHAAAPAAAQSFAAQPQQPQAAGNSQATGLWDFPAGVIVQPQHLSQLASTGAVPPLPADAPKSNRLLAAAYGLPSNISAFGGVSSSSGRSSSRGLLDAVKADRSGRIKLPSGAHVFGGGSSGGSKGGNLGGVGARRNSPLKLPSNISVFGCGGSSGGDRGANLDGGVGSGGRGGGFKLPSNLGSGFLEGSNVDVTGSQGGRGTHHQWAGVGLDDNAPQLQPGQGMAPERQSLPCPDPAALLASLHHVARSHVTVLNSIGEGSYGEVSCAEVDPFGLLAVKWLKKTRLSKYGDFLREISLMAPFNHPNVTRLIGLVTQPVNLWSQPLAEGKGGGSGGRAGGGEGGGEEEVVIIAGIMMEYVRGGSLGQRIRSLSQSGGRMSLLERCRVAVQACMGLSYLHEQSPAVVHFDVKPENLLLEGEGEALVVKVADFGLSRHKVDRYVSCRNLPGTLPYMAPELARNREQLDEKCDVHSMGVVMWEMASLEAPFAHLTGLAILEGLQQDTLTLPTPAGCEPEWQALITACVQSEPSARPSFKQLVETLEGMLGALVAAEKEEEQARVVAAAAQQQREVLERQAAATAAAVAQQRQLWQGCAPLQQQQQAREPLQQVRLPLQQVRLPLQQLHQQQQPVQWGMMQQRQEQKAPLQAQAAKGALTYPAAQPALASQAMGVSWASGTALAAAPIMPRPYRPQ